MRACSGITVNGELGEATGFRKETGQNGNLFSQKHRQDLVLKNYKTTFNERKLSKAETETKEKILKDNTHILPNFLPYCTLNMTVAFH